MFGCFGIINIIRLISSRFDLVSNIIKGVHELEMNPPANNDPLSHDFPSCFFFLLDVLNDLLDIESELNLSQTSEGMEEDDVDNVDVEDDEYDVLEEEFVSNGCVDYRASTFSTVSSLSTASKDSMFSTVSVASSEYSPLSTLSYSSQASGTDSDFFEDAEEESLSTA